MAVAPEIDPARLAGLGESRSRVLAVLQDTERALGVAELATRVRLHPNTIRFHLNALTRAALVEQTIEAPTGPGRPRALYRAVPGSGRSGQRSYRLLSAILAGLLATELPDPSRVAIEAGRAWGRHLTGRPPPFEPIEAEQAVTALVDALDGIGFAPEPVNDADGRKLLLHHCPFRETATTHANIVCSVHLGLMRGVLAELDAPVQVERLDPFVEPHLCIAYLVDARPTASERP